MRAKMRVPVDPPNPSGQCMCGCGETTPIAKKTRPERGLVAGEHVRYVKGHFMRGKKGPDHPQWKGGRWEHKGGYIYTYAPDHPGANRDGYVYEHRLIAEQTIGRHLTKKERVHHINGIKTDNRPENLIVMPSQSAHMAEHSPLDRWRANAPREVIDRVNSDAGRKGARARWGKH